MDYDVAYNVGLYYLNDIPENKQSILLEALQKADEDRFSSVMRVKMKKTNQVTLLSVLFGVFAVDRFYLADILIGIIKLLITLAIPITLIFLWTGLIFVPIVLVGLFLYLDGAAVLLFWAIDIFLCRKRTKEKNLKELLKSLS